MRERKGGKEGKGRGREGKKGRESEGCYTAGSEDGGRSTAKDCRQPPEAEKGEEMDSPLGASSRNQSC